MSDHLVNVDDYKDAAREALSQMVYDYYAGGSWDEITLGENSSAYDDLRLRFRVLRDINTRDLSTTVLGHRIELPVVVAPTAFHAMAHPEGEVATARAAGAAGTIMTVSTLSNQPIEAIVEAATGPVWFQLYVYRDRSATEALIQRVVAAGVQAIVLTVDAQLWGIRERDVRNRFRMPDDLKMSNLMASLENFPEGVEGSGLAAYVEQVFDTSLNWKDIEWLKSVCDVPIVLKGIVHPDDAKLAVEHEVDLVWVSNHGGRQVDTSIATVNALEQVVEAVDGNCEVIVDGGVRRGSDVVKAVCLGARAVAVGRPTLWGLAVDGQSGVERVLGILRHELDIVFGLCGASKVSHLTRDLIA